LKSAENVRPNIQEFTLNLVVQYLFKLENSIKIYKNVAKDVRNTEGRAERCRQPERGRRCTEYTERRLAK
jgi:hypothetical protein